MSHISETDLILHPDGSVYHLNLLPEHVTDTIISVGDPTRVARVSQFFESIEKEIKQREFVTHVGNYNGKRITVISTGIGTDNIEIFLTELDALVNIHLKDREIKKDKKSLRIIRIGTSGSLQEDINVGSHLFSACAVGLDNLMNFYNLEMDEVEMELAEDIQNQNKLPFRPYVVKGSSSLQKQFAFDMISGNTITAPGFYAPQGRSVRIATKYPTLLEDLNRYDNIKHNFRLTNFEMETAGYYALGRLLGHEVLSVNAIIANRIKGQFADDHNVIIDALIKKILDRI